MKVSRRGLMKGASLTAITAGLAISPIGASLVKLASAATVNVNGFTGIQHVGIYTTDTAVSIKFYKDIFGFEHLYTANAMEGDKPLKLSFLNLGNLYIELLEPVDKTTITSSAKSTLNHLCIRTTDMEKSVKHFKANKIEIEAGPFDTDMQFDRKVTDAKLFAKRGEKSVTLKIMFLRGPNGERFEIMQDNLGA